MARSIVMKALALATVNLRDGSILHLDPGHTSDNRARYPRVTDEDDADRLERENLAERHDGPIPALDTEAARAAEERASRRAEATDRRAEADVDKPKRVRNRSKAAGAATGAKTGGKGRGGAASRAAPASGARGSTAGGPGVETEDEAAAAADVLDGGDPTEAPAGGAGRRSD